MRRYLFCLLVCVTLSHTNVALGALDYGLVAYYPFSGNANDESGNGNNGVVNGALLTSDRFGQPNSAFSFDGVSDFIQVSSSTSLDIQDAITLSAWVHHLSNGGPQDIVNKFAKLENMPGFHGYRLTSWWANPTGNALEFRDENQLQHFVDDGQSPSIGMWEHVAGTWDGSTMRIYRGGQLMGENAFSGTIGLANNDLFIGALVFPNFNDQGFFHGFIDEVRVYNRALSGSEIQQLNAVPIPAALPLFLSALVLLGFVARRKQHG